MLNLIRFIVWFGLGNTCIFLGIGAIYLYFLLQAKTLFGTTFYAYPTLFGKSFVLFFTTTTYIGHFTLLAFLPLLICVFPFIIFKNKKIIFFLSVFIGTSSIALLLLDALIFSQYRFHLNFTILRIPFENGMDLSAFFVLSQTELFWGFILLLSIFLLEITMAYLIWHYIILKNRYFFGRALLSCNLFCLCLSYFILTQSIGRTNNVFSQQTPYFPLYNQFYAHFPARSNTMLDHYSESHFAQPLLPSAPLKYPQHALQCTPPDKPLNILLIGIDTWRFDMLQKKFMPHLYQFAQHAWQFKEHWSGGNATQGGLFSLFYGLPGNYWQSMIKQKKGPILLHELLKRDYHISIFFSSHMTPPFNLNVFSELKNLRTTPAPGKTAPDRDRFVTEDLLTFLKQSQQQPFFAFIFYDAAHDYCGEQNIPHLSITPREECNRFKITSLEAQKNLQQRYYNAIHFIDVEIAKLLAALKNAHLDQNTIIILTGDHGEEFNDNQLNYWGHASNYTSYQVQTPLIIAWPDAQAKIFNHRTTHYDIAPTLLQRVLNCKNAYSDYAIGTDLLNTQRNSYILANSYTNIGIIEKNRSTTLFSSGNIRINDDHGNELADQPNIKLIQQVLALMQHYYARPAH